MIVIALAALLGSAPDLGMPAPSPSPSAPAVAEPDWAALIGPPPDEGSAQDARDLAALLRLQAARSPADVDRILGEDHPGLDTFAAALGDGFDPARYPLTAHLLARAGRDLKAVAEPLKAEFGRPRPCLAHPDVIPIGPCHGGGSYPSFHAARGALFAALLADLAPDRAQAIQARGLQLGSDRALGGLHHPSDVRAGQRLGAAFLPHWLRQPGPARLLEAARWHEWQER